MRGRAEKIFRQTSTQKSMSKCSKVLENHRHSRGTTVLAGHSEILKCIVRHKTTRTPRIGRAHVEKFLNKELLENTEMFRGGSFLDRAFWGFN